MDVAPPAVSGPSSAVSSKVGSGSDGGDDIATGGRPAPRASSAPVLVVLVVDDEAPALEAVLAGLAAQDHARTDLLVVDVRRDGDGAGDGAGDGDGPSLVDRVGLIAPATLVVQAPDVRGYGAAVTAGIGAWSTERSESPDPRFLLFVPGEVVLGDTAVRRLVERAVEANAAVVGPKVVGPTGVLEETGWWFDVLGSPVPVVPDPEFDQGQHDTDLRPDAVAGAAWMVRTDLFVELGGLDVDGVDGTDHLDFCRRAQSVGASVAVVPSAVARRVGNPTSVRYPSALVWPRFRLRSVLTSPTGRLVVLMPVLAAATVLGVIYGVAAGRFRHARGLLAAWPWTLRRLGAARRSVGHGAPVGIPPGMDPGDHRTSWWTALRRVVTGRMLAGDDDRSDGLRRLNGAFGAVFGPGGLAIMIAVVVLGFGSRSLVTGGIPVVGRLQGLPDAPGDLLAAWWAGWRSTGTGTSGTGPDGLALIGLLNGIWPGSTDSLWTVLVLGTFGIGALGIWRLARPVGGGRSRAVAVLVYLAVPIPYDALRAGRLSPLAAYAVLPWVVRRLAGAQGMAPYGVRGGDPGPGTRLRGLWSDVLVTGLALAGVFVVDPVLVVPAAVVVLGLAAGTVLSGSVDGLTRLSTVVAGGMAVAVAVHLPAMSIAAADGGGWADWLGAGSSGAWDAAGSIGLSGVFALTTGVDGPTPTMALFVLPVLALFAARGRHLSVVVRAWFVAAAGAALLLGIDQDWIGSGDSALRSVDPAVLLVPVAIGLAWASAAGVAGLGADLAHLAGQVHAVRAARLIRNGLLGIVMLSLAVGTLPVLTGSFAGDWGTSREDLVAALPGQGVRLADGGSVRGGDARVLWIGHPVVIPAAGIPLSADGDRSAPLGQLVVAVTDARPDLSDQWSPGETVGLSELRDALVAALQGTTHRLGADLGRWGVARVVVVQRSAPVPEPGIERPVPDRLIEVLARQLDLERVEAVNRAMVVYRNTTVEAPFSVVRDRNRRVVPALVTRRSLTGWTVEVPADGALRWMVGPDDRWRVKVDERPATVLAADEVHGVAGRPSVRVASGSVATLQVDDRGVVGRRRVQLVLAGLLVLLTSWARTSRDAWLLKEARFLKEARSRRGRVGGLGPRAEVTP